MLVDSLETVHFKHACEYGITEAKIVSTPTDLSVKLQNDNYSKQVDQFMY